MIHETTSNGSGPEQDSYRRMARNFYLSIPLYLLVPIAFWRVFQAFAITMNWSDFGLGALGWIIALMLRGPVGLVVKNAPKKRAGLVVAASSGPLEEGVRVLMLLLLGLSSSSVLSFGQGWAAVEVLYAIVNGALLTTILQRNDEKAIQVKQILETQGTFQQNPWYGVLERVFASAFHIGSTLILAFNPWLVFVMMLVHTGMNLIAMHLAKKSLPLTETFVAVVGSITIAVGLVL